MRGRTPTNGGGGKIECGDSAWTKERIQDDGRAAAAAANIEDDAVRERAIADDFEHKLHGVAVQIVLGQLDGGEFSAGVGGIAVVQEERELAVGGGIEVPVDGIVKLARVVLLTVSDFE